MSTDAPRATGLAARFATGLKMLTSRLAEPEPVSDVAASLALKLAALRARAMREGIAALRVRRDGLRLGGKADEAEQQTGTEEIVLASES
jgi:hypothetical protein